MAVSDPGEDGDELVRAACAGDEGAFRVLYRSVAPGLLRYLRVLVGEDAEDVASETWLQVARDVARFSGDLEGFRGWVATIGRHRALDHLRRVRRRPVSAVSVEDAGLDWAGWPDAGESAMETLGTEAALELIASLPRDQAEAVLLRVVLGLDATAAGRVLGKRAGAVRTAAYRGLRTLAGRLSQGTSETSANIAGKPSRERGVTHLGAAALREVR
ncbi:RNA polymerase sigma factor [Amycolatopsis taiwanensis]|uniref:RNA polymerase sigma factor n=1 Tax=Amycolatopsis taiwanensis TaxID=342230 RepID=UPI001B80AB13|nr:RNA polymerase sigma factor [Amycolatopsis taiwanensis]